MIVPLLAGEAAPSGGSTLAGLMPLVLIAVVFYFLLIRPQQKRARQQQSLVSSVAAGDRIVTIGGVHATVVSIDEDTMRLEIAPGTVVTMSRGAVARKLVDADTPGGGSAGQLGGPDTSDQLGGPDTSGQLGGPDTSGRLGGPDTSGEAGS